MEKEFTYNDVPLDVLEVWAIQSVGRPVGSSTWNHCNETIKKYPEWFPDSKEDENKNKNMYYPQVDLKIDAMLTPDVKDVANSFLSTGVNFIGMDECFEEATSLMEGTDNSDLKNLFEDGVRLGIFLAKNEHLIPKI